MDIITSHIQTDFDALGSMLAAKILYPDALIVFSRFTGEECPRLSTGCSIPGS